MGTVLQYQQKLQILHSQPNVQGAVQILRNIGRWRGVWSIYYNVLHSLRGVKPKHNRTTISLMEKRGIIKIFDKITIFLFRKLFLKTEEFEEEQIIIVMISGKYTILRRVS